MRILVWHWGRRGAGPRYTLDVARALAARPDVTVHLSVSRQAEIYRDLAESGLPMHSVDTYNGRWSAAWNTARLPLIGRGLRRYVDRHRIDLVYCTMTHLWNAFVVRTLRTSRARYVFTVHDAVLHPGERIAVRQLLLSREIREADGLVALTDHVRQQALHLAAPRSIPSWVIPLPPLRYGEAEAPRRLDAGRPVRLLFFGRILPYKGVDLLGDAFRIVLERGLDVELRVVGEGDSSALARSVRGLPRVVIENRWVPEREIGSLLASADIVVLPYREASQSGVIPVAYAHGVPVVATPVGGLLEQVVPNVTGVISGDVTPPAIADAITSLVTNPDLYARCSEAAMHYARERLDWPSTAEQLVMAFRTVLDGGAIERAKRAS